MLSIFCRMQAGAEDPDVGVVATNESFETVAEAFAGSFLWQAKSIANNIGT